MVLSNEELHERRTAALNVCSSMTSHGYPIQEIREVLETLGLLTGLTARQLPTS